MKSVTIFLLVVGTTFAIYFDGQGGRHSSSSSEEHGGHGPRPGPGGPGRGGNCSPGWLRFERQSGVWCVFVGLAGINDNSFAQKDGQSACAALGATLTGFQNDKERMAVADEAGRKLGAAGGGIAGLWLGATTRAGCKAGACGPLNTFMWTDGVTTGTAGLKWATGEPDSVDYPGTAACIQQFIMLPNWVPGPFDLEGFRTGFTHGILDKFSCIAPVTPETRMYACGKMASGGRG